MQSGCICCTIRGDLSEAIRGLYARRERGEVSFARLVIETTGLADPTPILATIMHDPQIRHHFQLENVITTVDAVNGSTHLQRQPESVKQAALADNIIVTKADLADAADVDALEARLTLLNPSARRWRSANAPPPAEWLLAEGDLNASSGTSTAASGGARAWRPRSRCQPSRCTYPGLHANFRWQHRLECLCDLVHLVASQSWRGCATGERDAQGCGRRRAGRDQRGAALGASSGSSGGMARRLAAVPVDIHCARSLSRGHRALFRRVSFFTGRD